MKTLIFSFVSLPIHSPTQLHPSAPPLSQLLFSLSHSPFSIIPSLRLATAPEHIEINYTTEEMTEYTERDWH